jgi:hypothetical protein
MTFKILSRYTKKIIYQSNVRSAERKETHNKRLDNNDGIQTMFVKSKLDDMPTDSETLRPMPDFNPGEMIGWTYLDLPQEDGQKFCMKIIKAIADQKDDLDKHPEIVKFLVKAKDGDYEESLAYNDIEEEDIENQYFRFQDISNHQDPLLQKTIATRGASTTSL